MRRIRIVFLLLAVLLLVSMGLLVRRALESVALEREVSHRAVAERLVDEMERELSRILRSEEERSFAAYDFDAFGKAGADANERADAPGPGGASRPYVAGYFQVDPDGSFSSPPSAPHKGAPTRPAHGRQWAGAAAAPLDLEAAVIRGLRSGAEASSELAALGGIEQAPGTTRELRGLATRGQEELAGDEADAAGKSKDRKQVSPYEALQSLNKAAVLRRERQAKLVAPQPALRDRADAPSSTGQAAANFAARAAPGAAELEAKEQWRPSVLAESAEPAGVAELEGEDDRSARPQPVAQEVAVGEPGVEIHPMVGRLIDDEHLLLYRMVLLGDQGYRQGLVVDIPALFRWLDASVVGGSELSAFVGRDFFTVRDDAPEPREPGAFEYLHRFAEPFDALAVRLTLAPLPDVGGAGYLYALAALLLVSGPVGLFALYRMVAVRVRFAERRSNFVAAVSHELKTPLTAIRMYGEMLRDGMVDDEAKRREYYGTITAESERLTRLINNVLEFSRLEQGTREMSLVVGPVGPVVREAAALLVPHAAEVGFRIEVEVEEGLPPVRFDRDAVLQVVYNLVDNALKYAREAGDRRIAIACARSGEDVVVAVRDRGPGVPTRHLAKIFEAFYRGESELTRTAKGTGIGLALVRGLAETMGAAVSVRNRAEGGFEVALSFRPVATG